MEVDLVLTTDTAGLVAAEGSVFSPDDCFSFDLWEELIAFWFALGGNCVGFIGLSPHVSVGESPDEDTPNPGCLFVASIGIFEEYQRQGLGTAALREVIAWAKANGYTHMNANCRMSNVASRYLFEGSGFVATRVIPNYYARPVEGAISLDLSF